MCLVFVSDEDKSVIGRQPAALGACPYCGGVTQAVDVHNNWNFCFVPIYSKNKRRFYCIACSRRHVVQEWKTSRFV